jgi:hypothetical protein
MLLLLALSDSPALQHLPCKARSRRTLPASVNQPSHLSDSQARLRRLSTPPACISSSSSSSSLVVLASLKEVREHHQTRTHLTSRPTWVDQLQEETTDQPSALDPPPFAVLAVAFPLPEDLVSLVAGLAESAEAAHKVARASTFKALLLPVAEANSAALCPEAVALEASLAEAAVVVEAEAALLGLVVRERREALMGVLVVGMRRG